MVVPGTDLRRQRSPFRRLVALGGAKLVLLGKAARPAVWRRTHVQNGTCPECAIFRGSVNNNIGLVSLGMTATTALTAGFFAYLYRVKQRPYLRF